MTLKKFNSGALTTLSILLGLIWLAPLVWLIGTALTEPSFNMPFIPTTPFTTENLTYVWNAIPFGQYYLNTIILVVVTFAIQFVTYTLAGYALAFYSFKGQALMFVVIFMEQWLKEKNHTSSILGLLLSLICLCAFGAENFIIPAMLAILAVLTLIRKPLEAEKGGDHS